MRIDVLKFLFVGDEKERLRFFLRAQECGIIEFIDRARSKLGVPPEIHRLMAARKILRSYPPTKQEDLDDLGEADPIAERVLELHDRLGRLEEERRLLRQEIGRVEVFGDFDPNELRWIEEHGSQVVQFFFAKIGKGVEEAREIDGLIWVGSHLGLDYYLSIAPERRSLPNLFTEMQVDRSAAQLEIRRESAAMEMRVIESEIKGYEKRSHFLHKRIIDRLNAYHLFEAGSSAERLFDGHLFAVTGWVPSDKVAEVEQIAAEFGIDLEQIAKDPEDFEPTYLENHGFSQIGEDLVHIYDTPSTTDRDPSLWVICFFALFFAIIVGDAGYGLILLLTTLWMMRKARKAAGFVKRFTRLCLLLSCSVLVWGVVTASYFGISVPASSPLQRISFVTWLVEKKASYVMEQQGPDYQLLIEQHPTWVEYSTVKDLFAQGGEDAQKLYSQYANNVMIELALLLGVIHISLSFLRMIDRNWSGIGWILFIVGAYLWAPSIFSSISMINYVGGVSVESATHYGLQILIIGFGLALVIAPIQKRLSGLTEALLVIQLFADVLSYLRLYALGLAGAIVSQTFNLMGAEAGLVFGAIIILLGNVVNIALAIMGGVIHGLRLNFLEWYRWSFGGGGRMLQPLKLLHYK